MPTPSIQTLVTDAQQVLNLDSISAVRSVVAVALANANTGTPLNPNLTTQQLWNEFYQVVTKPKSDIESIIANQLMKFLFAPPAPGGVGANGQVIFNDGGVLAGDPQFLWNKTTNLLTVTGSATITGDLTVDTSTLKVDSVNNRVGIGTATPAVDLHIQAAGSASAEVRLASATRSYNIGSTGSGYGSANNLIIYDLTGAAERYRLDASGNHFWNNVGGVAGTAMTLNSTGLGVGGSPASKLSIFAGADGDVGFFRGGSTRQLQIGTSATAGYLNADNGSAGFELRVNGTARAYFDTSGNVGIGVTPQFWGSNWKAIDLAGGGRVYTVSGTGTHGFSFNAFNNNTNWLYQFSTVASRFELQQSGNFAWFTAPSGTAGTAITFTQAMTLDASGNLLVGVTSNPNTARAYFRYDTLTTQPVINSASIVAAATTWNHFVGQSGNGSTVTTNNIFIRGNGDVVNANGIYGTISDLRLKENISDARNYLADLLKLRVVKYSLKEEASAVANKLGFIAQEVEQVFPTMVDTDSEDTKSIKISVLIPMLVKAIQELTARVQTLETR